MNKLELIDNIFAKHYLQTHFNCNCLKEVEILLSDNNNDATAAGSENQSAKITRITFSTFKGNFFIEFGNKIDPEKVTQAANNFYLTFIGELAGLQRSVVWKNYELLKDKYQKEEDEKEEDE